jgi:lactoylglutathione lyase
MVDPMAKENPASAIKFRIRHTMLAVKDLDRSMDFYTRLLGMNIMRLRDQADQRIAYLGYGSEDDGPALEMVQMKGPGPQPDVPHWAGHVALYASDLCSLSKTLKAEGVKFVSEPQPVRPGTPDLVAWIQDPDGYTIELSERHTLTGPPLRR